MKRSCCAALLLLPNWLLAQQMVSVSVDRNQVNVNELVKFTLQFKAGDLVWCGLKVNFGDRDEREVRVENLPLVLMKEYTAAGRYEFRAEGKFVIRGIKTALPCMGSALTAPLIVSDPAVSKAAEVEAKEQEFAQRERQLREREEALTRQERDRVAAAAQERASAAAPAAAPPRVKPRPAVPAASVAKPKEDKDDTLKVFRPTK